METTFITIHDLTREARILYSSDSIVDILGHTPDEVVGKSSWDFFHPDEVPVAKQMHSRGVRLDKAAVLAYCNVLNRQGHWVCCECCFSVVYDVMVCCTSIYRRGVASQKRAVEAPIVRRLFSSSPRDPRYHMLSHLSSKFQQGQQEQTHEPRAALFLNRFTRTLTIMYATAGIEQIIGVSGEDMKGRSFYYCIQENCLEDAVRCLESAKGNDSIAYLRFWFRDPRLEDEQDANTSSAEDTDEAMTDITNSEDEAEGGVDLRGYTETSPANELSRDTSNPSTTDTSSRETHPGASESNGEHSHTTRTNSGSLSAPRSTHSSLLNSPATNSERESNHGAVELEAVVSCTSDGLVVCLRRARPALPPAAQPQVPSHPTYANGLFAAPWAPEPVFVPALQAPQPVPAEYPVGYYGGPIPGTMGPSPLANYRPGPAHMDLMNSIRDVAVFAWALTGINGSLQEYSRGTPKGDSQPPDGFPLWQPHLPAPTPLGQTTPLSGYVSAYDPFGDPGLSHGDSRNGSGSSHDSGGARSA